jgi:predicted amino acid dehydrogenase
LKPIQKLKQGVSNLYLAIDSIAENRSLGYETLMNKLEEISSLAEKYRNFDLEGLE